jgi:hypothetical protein
MKTNPLKQLTEEELKDYEFCLSQNFCRVRIGNKITEDYTKWLPTYNELILYVNSEKENIYDSYALNKNKTIGEVAKILLKEELRLRK